MIKVILAGLLLAGSVFANDVNTKGANEDYKTTEALLKNMKKELPTIYPIYSDYFTAKTCSKDFAKSVSIKEIREFASTELYGKLFMLKNDDRIISKASYSALISSYEFMNCGNMEKLGSFVGSVSAMSVEMEDMQNK